MRKMEIHLIRGKTDGGFRSNVCAESASRCILDDLITPHSNLSHFLSCKITQNLMQVLFWRDTIAHFSTGNFRTKLRTPGLKSLPNLYIPNPVSLVRTGNITRQRVPFNNRKYLFVIEQGGIYLILCDCYWFLWFFLAEL